MLWSITIMKLRVHSVCMARSVCAEMTNMTYIQAVVDNSESVIPNALLFVRNQVICFLFSYSEDEIDYNRGWYLSSGSLMRNLIR